MKYFATGIVSTIILVAVLIPGPNLPDVGVGGFDKLVHIGMFGLWALAVRFDFASKYKFAVAMVAGMSFSLFTEILQVFVEGRTYDWYDIAADGLGLVVGLLLSGPVLKLLGRNV